MDYVSIILPFIGGLGMFIYGMQIMAQGLENAAGSKMKSLLEVLTKNKFFGVLLGAFITAVIQSSSATTVMVVGFVNAGIMNLTQAMGVIMGANIGTTVTGWLVSSVEWAKALSPANIAQCHDQRKHYNDCKQNSCPSGNAARILNAWKSSLNPGFKMRIHQLYNRVEQIRNDKTINNRL